MLFIHLSIWLKTDKLTLAYQIKSQTNILRNGSLSQKRNLSVLLPNITIHQLQVWTDYYGDTSILVKDKLCLKRIINIADVCFELGYQLSHFKTSMSIVIPKPNKESYDSPKSFRHIVLLNTIGKLIERVISNQLQFHLILNNFIHPSQLGVIT